MLALLYWSAIKVVQVYLNLESVLNFGKYSISDLVLVFPRTTLMRSVRSWVPNWSCWDLPAASSLNGCWPRWTPRWAAASCWPAATSSSCSREVAPLWECFIILLCRRACPPARYDVESTATSAPSRYCSKMMLEDLRYVERGKRMLKRDAIWAGHRIDQRRDKKGTRGNERLENE